MNSTVKKVAATAIALEIIVGVWNVYSPDKAAFPIQQAAKSVARLDMPKSMGARCTGWKIAPKMYMTNNHCFWSESSLPVILDGVECNEVLDTEHGTLYDYTLFSCPENDKRYIEIAEQSPVGGDNMHLIHVNCNYKDNPGCKPELVVSDGNILGQDEFLIKYDADSLGGSSGSVVVNSDGKAIGLHNLGYGDTNGDGYGQFNSAVKISFILEKMKSKGIDILAIQAKNPQEKLEAPILEQPKEKKKWSGLFSAIFDFLKALTGVK